MSLILYYISITCYMLWRSLLKYPLTLFFIGVIFSIGGMVGFVELLPKIADVWKINRDDIKKSVEENYICCNHNCNYDIYRNMSYFSRRKIHEL